MTNLNQASFEVEDWWDEKMSLLFGNEAAQEASTLKKIEEEFIEFLRDPSSAEAADVVIAMIVWMHIRDSDLADAIHQKTMINELRQWHMTTEGTFHHVEPEGHPARQHGTRDCTLCGGDQPFSVCATDGTPCQVRTTLGD